MHLPLRDVGVADFEVRPPPARAEALVSLSLPLLLAACVLPVLSNATHAHKVAARHAMAISGVCGRRLSPGAARNHRSPYSFTNYSVSGFSAGGSMALFHLVSHSASVTGVGLVGGSPYASTLHITPSSPLSKWDKLFDYFFFACSVIAPTHGLGGWVHPRLSSRIQDAKIAPHYIYILIIYLWLIFPGVQRQQQHVLRVAEQRQIRPVLGCVVCELLATRARQSVASWGSPLLHTAVRTPYVWQCNGQHRVTCIRVCGV